MFVASSVLKGRHEEVGAYIEHRMRLAGAHAPVFKPAAIEAVALASNRIPRKINCIAHHALIAAADGSRTAGASAFSTPTTAPMPSSPAATGSAGKPMPTSSVPAPTGPSEPWPREVAKADEGFWNARQTEPTTALLVEGKRFDIIISTAGATGKLPEWINRFQLETVFRGDDADQAGDLPAATAPGEKPRGQAHVARQR